MGLDCLRHSPRRDDHWGFLRRPLLLDPPDDSIDRIDRPIKHPRPNAFIGPAGYHLFRGHDVGGRKLRGAPKEGVGGDHYSRLNDPTEEGAICGDAVVGSRGPEVHYNRIALVKPTRRKSVRNAVGAHGKWLLHVELYRQFGAGIDPHPLSAAGP